MRIGARFREDFMTLLRLWLIWFLVAIAWLPGASAQQSTDSTAGGSATGDGTAPAPADSGSTGASSAFGSGSSSPAPSPFTGGAAAPPGSGSTATPAIPGAGTPATPESPAGGTLPAVKPLDAGPTTFSISTGYGRAPEVFVSGEGRLSRPKFDWSVSGSVGFDDNVFQTPTRAVGTPDTVVQEQITAGTAAQVVLVPVKNTKPQRIGIIAPPPQPQQYRQVIIPGEAAQFQDIVIPGTPKPKRQASAISRESISMQAQTATRRTVFTFDLSANADYYWNRPSKKAEYNGSLAIRYLHRFTPRLDVTAAVDAAYLSQPDLTQINTPTTTGNGNYLTASAKVDLSYRWTPRFSTVASLTYNQLSYEEKLKQVGDYMGYGFGLSLNYLWTPRITAVAEGRYGHLTYSETPSLDSNSYYALIGMDLRLTRRSQASIRVGEVMRTFDQSGNSQTAPYLETTLNYQLGVASVLSWTNRFGFEEPPDANTEVLAFRSSVAINHAFGPRLRGSLSINGIHRSTKNTVDDTKSTDDTLDTALGFYYTLTRKWSLNLSYTYTTVFFSPNGTNTDYFRDRVFAGFDYEF
jgi:hypothetical protein